MVWKSPAEAASHILLSQTASGSGPPGGAKELPIQEVLRLLQDHEFMEERAQTSGWDAEIVVRKEAALGRVARDDFMAPQPNDVSPDPLQTVERRRSILRSRS